MICNRINQSTEVLLSKSIPCQYIYTVYIKLYRELLDTTVYLVYTDYCTSVFGIYRYLLAYMYFYTVYSQRTIQTTENSTLLLSDQRSDPIGWRTDLMAS